MKTSALSIALFAVAAAGCHNHDDGHDDGHGDAPHAEEEEGPEPLAITRWTDGYELFVELPPPAPGKPVPYHAHVTRLSDFGAVTEGKFRVRFKSGATVAAEAEQEGVKRPGIFVFEAPAPSAGVYELEMSYELGGKTDVFDCGSVTVADEPPEAAEEAGSTITFLKESQWKIPFGTGWAEQRALAREIELPAIVEPAGGDQLTVGAPTGGRFFHNPKLSLAEGLRVSKGTLLGTIVPNVAGDDYSLLVSAVEEAKLAKEQVEREIERIEPLVKDKLLPEKRVIELRQEREREASRLKSARRRLGKVTASGSDAGLEIKSTLEGLVTQVLVPNGEPVEAGAALVRVGGTDHLWIRARFVARPASTLLDAAPNGVRLPSGTRIDLDPSSARFLSALPIVDAASRVATWIVDVAPGKDVAAAQRDSPELVTGTSVVLSVRLGKPKSVVAVERGAVVEINTRPYVFVQVDGEHFEKRAVTVGRSDGPFVEIATGVQKGDRVVTKGGFDIHLAALMGTIESHRH